MELIKIFVDVFLHLDKHLDSIILHYGVWTYLLIFLIIFCETGLVVTPFLPGDSLLFAIGSLAAIGTLRVELLMVLLATAAVAGDTLNYAFGHYMGPKVFSRRESRIFRREYLDKTQRFYERYGGKTVILARFVPIVRTFAPFVAGVGAMSYGRFLSFNVIGGVAWIVLFIGAGYFFGTLPAVKHNFTLVIMVIIFISILPGLIEYARHRRRAS